MIILNVTPAAVAIKCDCGEEVTTQTKAFNPGHLEEFDQYENLHLDTCPECERMNVLNMNIPPTGLEEEEIEAEPFFTDQERNNREKVRDIMFMHRPDLKGKDRAAMIAEQRQQIESRYGLDLEIIRSQKQRVKKLTLGEM
jgi:small nuclear ribonucleoprotein (snRNP)-like protein